MRGNIIDYVRDYGKYDFKEMPFNEVDALVLAKFVYLKLEKIIQPGHCRKYAMSVQELCEHPDLDVLFEQDDNEELDRALFREMSASKRFGTMKCTNVIADTSLQEETQFMAMTCILPNENRKVVFRGTDNTLIGWKENFNMAFQSPIAGQKSAQKYLKKVMRWNRRTIDVIGHSKGGNLAVYAAMKVSWFMQSRIVHIYNLDGPGFRSEVFARNKYKRVIGKIIKIVPQTCLVGGLLESHGSYKAVRSVGNIIEQHFLYSWQVEEGSLVYVDNPSDIYQIVDENLNNLLMSLSKKDLEIVVNTLYQNFVGPNDVYLKDAKKGIIKKIYNLQKMEGEKKEVIEVVLQKIITCFAERFLEDRERIRKERIDDLQAFFTKR